MMMKFIIQFIIFTGFILQIYGTAHYVKLHYSGDDKKSCILLTEETIKRYKGFNENIKSNSIQIITKNAYNLPIYSDKNLNSYNPPDDTTSQIIEIYGKNKFIVDKHINTKLCKTKEYIKQLDSKSLNIKTPEILKIINNGNQNNRIDVVFMGDGYNINERNAFFNDINRLTNDMFEGDTFKSYLPIFNIWGIYVESIESGIGYNGPKNTPFRLYRQSGQLRGIFPGNSSYARQICLLTGPSGCDYPSLIANDDYYGGLGGEFVISTKSNRTGTIVLRHEMGHNFIDVGEEYDDGSVYSGVNSAKSLDTLGWKSWLSSNSSIIREEKMIYRLLDYPWHDLSLGSKSFTFTSDGTYNNWYLQVSVTAAGDVNSLEFILDGIILPWETRGSDDREFYDWFGKNGGFSSGNHTFIVTSKTIPTNPDIPRMIASITIHEYGNETEFNFSPNHISAYPTWDVLRRKTYRPTNEACSMRNMTSSSFCPVCKEGMWMQFLKRISLIDSINIDDTTITPKNVTLNTLKLGQLREPDKQIFGEELKITWYLNNFEQIALSNQFNIRANPGNWSVQVKFITPEIRYDPNLLTIEKENFII